jgi:hypothetical protein
MSRSKRKPIIKDRPRNKKKSTLYWRIVRRVINGRVRILKDNPTEEQLPEPKEIVNDYDYCDWISDFRDPFWTQFRDKEYIEKKKRK